MKARKRMGTVRDPESPERRRMVKGGLLAAAAALGFLPSCGDDEEAAPTSGADAGGSPGTATNPSGAPAIGGRPTPAGGTSGGSSQSTAGTEVAGSSGMPSNAGVPGMQAGAGAGATPAAPSSMTLPRGTLGKTGVSIPIVGLGTSRLGQRGGTPNAADYDNMLEVFEAAMNMGIEYIDTGASYGRAEEALGELIPSRRDKIFLATKLYTDTRAQAEMLFERSLERLQTDHVDLLHLHSTGERNVDTVLSQDGSWPYILGQKAMGRTRFVGITGHNNPPNFLRMIETDEVDVLMTIMNFVDHSTYGLSRDVRAAAVERNMGVMAMKVFGGTESVLMPGGGLANSNAPEPHPSNMQIAFDESVLPDCMRFVKSLEGVTGMVIGINFIEELERNIQWAIETQPFSAEELDAVIRMGETIAPRWAQRYG